MSAGIYDSQNDTLIPTSGYEPVSQTVISGDTSAVSGDAVYNYVDTMITQALTASY